MQIELLGQDSFDFIVVDFTVFLPGIIVSLDKDKLICVFAIIQYQQLPDFLTSSRVGGKEIPFSLRYSTSLNPSAYSISSAAP